MALFHTTVDPSGYTVKGFEHTFNISGTVTAADVGKGLAVDTAAANTLKIAGDGERIAARLETLELRKTGNIGTASFKFIQNFPVKTGDLLAVGDTAVGAPNGEVKKGTAAPHDNFVSNVSGGVATVVKL